MRKLLMLVLAALAQPALAAVVGTHVTVSAVAGGPEETLGDADQASDVGSASAAAIATHSGASADAFVDFGVIKVLAQANSQAGGYNAGAGALGSWTDIVTLSSGSFNGLQARITASTTLQGFISTVGTGRGAVVMDFDVGIAGTSFNTSREAGESLFHSDIHEVTLNVTLGNSFVLKETLQVGAGSKPACDAGASPACLSLDSGSVDVDFGHSSYWNGITSIAVRNPSTGLFEAQDLSLFTLSANSGTDYFKSFVPVPLPAATWLFAPALVLLSRQRRRTAGIESPGPKCPGATRRKAGSFPPRS